MLSVCESVDYAFIFPLSPLFPPAAENSNSQLTRESVVSNYEQQQQHNVAASSTSQGVIDPFPASPSLPSSFDRGDQKRRSSSKKKKQRKKSKKVTKIEIQLGNNSPRITRKLQLQQHHQGYRRPQSPPPSPPLRSFAASPSPAVKKVAVEEKQIPKLRPESIQVHSPARPKEQERQQQQLAKEQLREEQTSCVGVFSFQNSSRDSSLELARTPRERTRHSSNSSGGKRHFASVTPPRSILKGYLSATEDESPTTILPRRRTDTATSSSYDEEIIKSLVTEKVLGERRARRASSSPSPSYGGVRSIPANLQIKSSNSSSSHKPPLPPLESYLQTVKPAGPAEFKPKSRNFFEPPKTPVTIKPCPNPLRPPPLEKEDLEVESALRSASLGGVGNSSVRSQSSLATLIGSSDCDREFSVTIRPKKGGGAASNDEDFALPLASDRGRRKSVGDRVQSWDQKISSEDERKARQISLDLVKERSNSLNSNNSRGSGQYTSAASKAESSGPKQVDDPRKSSVERDAIRADREVGDLFSAGNRSELQLEEAPVPEVVEDDTKKPKLKSILKPPSPSPRDWLLNTKFEQLGSLSSSQQYQSVYKPRESPSFSTLGRSSPYSNSKFNFNSLPQAARKGNYSSSAAEGENKDHLRSHIVQLSSSPGAGKSNSLPRLNKDGSSELNKGSVPPSPSAKQDTSEAISTKPKSSFGFTKEGGVVVYSPQVGVSTSLSSKLDSRPGNLSLLLRPTSFTEFYEKNLSLCDQIEPIRSTSQLLEQEKPKTNKDEINPRPEPFSPELSKVISSPNSSSSYSVSRHDLNSSKLSRPSQFIRSSLLSPAPYRAPSPSPTSNPLSPSAAAPPPSSFSSSTSSPGRAAADYHNKAAAGTSSSSTTTTSLRAAAPTIQAAAYFSFSDSGQAAGSNPIQANAGKAGDVNRSSISREWSSGSNSNTLPWLEAAPRDEDSVLLAAAAASAAAAAEPERQKNSLAAAEAVRSEQEKDLPRRESWSTTTTTSWIEEQEKNRSGVGGSSASGVGADDARLYEEGEEEGAADREKKESAGEIGDNKRNNDGGSGKKSLIQHTYSSSSNGNNCFCVESFDM